MNQKAKELPPWLHDRPPHVAAVGDHGDDLEGMKPLPFRVQMAVVWFLLLLWLLLLGRLFVGPRIDFYVYFPWEAALFIDSFSFFYVFVSPLFLAFLSARMFDCLDARFRKKYPYTFTTAFGFLPLLLEIGLVLFFGIGGRW